MSRISSAVGSERLSRVSGYRIRKGFFAEDTGNLPQVILVLGQANTANEATMPLTVKEIISADEAGRLYGYGSQIHAAMRILRPLTSDGVGGIPTYVLPQKALSGAEALEIKYELTGTATKSGVQYILINGRESIDFHSLSFNVVKGDTATIIAGKIKDAVNGVLNAPVSATSTAGAVTLTSKWKGVTSNDISIDIDNDGLNLGITYAKTTEKVGSGLADFTGIADAFEIDWITSVVHGYGTSVFDTLENINGVPYVDSPIGRYNPIVFKPFMAFMGTNKSDYDDLVALASGRSEQVTNVIIPAPMSKSMPIEISASTARIFARTMQDTPEKDVNEMGLMDIVSPADGNIGDMSSYNNRDLLVKKGVSTVVLKNGEYKIQDLVTTYSPSGEMPYQFSYCRNLNLDWNIKFKYSIYEDLYLKDKVIIRDNQFTDSNNTIKPKQWKSNVSALLDELAQSALINDPDWSKERLRVEVDAVNPNRFNTFFPYRRTGIARIQSTDVEAGF